MADVNRFGAPTLPSREQEFRRVFSAINGEELRKILHEYLEDMIERDGRFTKALTCPVFAFRMVVDLVVQPEINPRRRLETAGGGVVVDPETNDIVIDALWPRAIAMRGVTDSGIVDTPDNLRQAVGLEVPSVKRREGGRMYQRIADMRQGARREGTMTKDEQELLERLPPHLARALQEAWKQRPHVKHRGEPQGDAESVVAPPVEGFSTPLPDELACENAILREKAARQKASALTPGTAVEINADRKPGQAESVVAAAKRIKAEKLMARAPQAQATVQEDTDDGPGTDAGKGNPSEAAKAAGEK